MMQFPPLCSSITRVRHLSGTLVLMVLLATPTVVLAHAGHGGHEFQGGAEANTAPTGIAVDAQTMQRMGMRVEPVQREFMDVGIKTTGQIETLPNKKVEVTSPIAGKVVQLLAEPGDQVEKGEIVAVLSSPELASLRVETLQNSATAEAEFKQAQANLQLVRENYQRQQQIANAELEQAQNQLMAAEARYQRDQGIVNQGAVINVAKENYQRQIEIAEAEISQAETELSVAQEQHDRDLELMESGAIPRRTFLESKAHLAEAQADLARAKSQRDVLAAETTVRQAEVDLPVRDLRESEILLAEAQAQLVRAKQRREVLEAEADLKKAQAELEAAKSRLNLSDTTYTTRLRQLGTGADQDGTVSIAAPISGIVSDREITLGQSVDESGLPLMTIQDNSQVFATANLYEKDLEKVKVGQRVQVKVSGLDTQVFSGNITKIAPFVEGETRVIPVWAALENKEGKLKPGQFAELEIITSKTANSVLSIPANAVVEMNGKSLVYVQNGESYTPVEVTLGETSNNRVEVKKGLFEGDQVVSQGAMQLYAQSLRGGNQKAEEKKTEESLNLQQVSQSFFPWLILPVGGAIALGSFWLGRRTKPKIQSESIPNFSISKRADLPEEYMGKFCERPAISDQKRS